jgi:hypothetical protein
MVKAVGRLEIGQCVVVKNRMVLAVGDRGYDETIRRGGRLATAAPWWSRWPIRSRICGSTFRRWGQHDRRCRKSAPRCGCRGGENLMLDKADLLEAARKAAISVGGLREAIPG